jgi:DNA-binding XRE family transcriptional regulator
MFKITLEAARVNAGLDQKSAAKALGVSNKTLCNWENYITFPNAVQVTKICELYGAPYDIINFLPDRSLKTSV